MGEWSPFSKSAPSLFPEHSRSRHRIPIGNINQVCLSNPKNFTTRRANDCSGDKPLNEALKVMNHRGISSLAVVDNSYNVVGNISTTDVKVSLPRPPHHSHVIDRHQLLTKSTSAPLLDNTCIHFVSVILTTRGMNDGKDSIPVFHVNPYSTLAHTVAKLVATRSHR